MSAYCDGVGCRVNGMAFLCGSILVKVPVLRAPLWYDLRCLKATSNTNNVLITIIMSLCNITF